MASRHTGTDWESTCDNHGEEARPRPQRAVRLVDVMAGVAPKQEVRSPEETAIREADACGPAFHASHTRKKTTMPPCASTPAVNFPADGYAVLSVYPEGEGEVMAVVLSLPAYEAAKNKAGKESVLQDAPSGTPTKPIKLTLHLLPEQYADLGVKTGDITPERADELIAAGKLCGAIRRGLALLGYGDQSARKLTYKLTSKGIDRETAARAVAYLTEKGYVRESGTATLRAQQDARKLWGPRRIREDLQAQGFTPDAVDEALEALSETDWVENCVAAIRKKQGDVPADRAARQKFIAAVMRLGYDADTVREAMRIILRES